MYSATERPPLAAVIDTVTFNERHRRRRADVIENEKFNWTRKKEERKTKITKTWDVRPKLALKRDLTSRTATGWRAAWLKSYWLAKLTGWPAGQLSSRPSVGRLITLLDQVNSSSNGSVFLYLMIVLMFDCVVDWLSLLFSLIFLTECRCFSVKATDSSWFGQCFVQVATFWPLNCVIGFLLRLLLRIRRHLHHRRPHRQHARHLQIVPSRFRPLLFHVVKTANIITVRSRFLTRLFFFFGRTNEIGRLGDWQSVKTEKMPENRPRKRKRENKKKKIRKRKRGRQVFFWAKASSFVCFFTIETVGKKRFLMVLSSRKRERGHSTVCCYDSWPLLVGS